MHPIERLRYVARAGSAPDRVLVAEAVPALASFARDPGARLVALRRLINRQPESPGLVVLAARVLTSLEPIEIAWRFVDELDTDPTEHHADRLAESTPHVVDLIDTVASGPGVALCPSGTKSWIRDARHGSNRVVAITPLGSRLPDRLWQGFVERNDPEDVPGGFEYVRLDSFDELIDPTGRQPIVSWSPDCPDVAELSSF